MGKFDFHVLSYGLHKLHFHWTIQKKKHMVLGEHFKITTLLDMQVTNVILNDLRVFTYLLTYSMEQNPA